MIFKVSHFASSSRKQLCRVCSVAAGADGKSVTAKVPADVYKNKMLSGGMEQFHVCTVKRKGNFSFLRLLQLLQGTQRTTFVPEAGRQMSLMLAGEQHPPSSRNLQTKIKHQKQMCFNVGVKCVWKEAYLKDKVNFKWIVIMLEAERTVKRHIYSLDTSLDLTFTFQRRTPSSSVSVEIKATDGSRALHMHVWFSFLLISFCTLLGVSQSRSKSRHWNHIYLSVGFIYTWHEKSVEIINNKHRATL